MGKAFFLIAYGMAWGYVIHAKEIDKKVAAVARDLWEDHVRSRVAIEMSEYDRIMTLSAGQYELQREEKSLHAAG